MENFKITSTDIESGKPRIFYANLDGLRGLRVEYHLQAFINEIHQTDPEKLHFNGGEEKSPFKDALKKIRDVCDFKSLNGIVVFANLDNPSENGISFHTNYLIQQVQIIDPRNIELKEVMSLFLEQVGKKLDHQFYPNPLVFVVDVRFYTYFKEFVDQARIFIHDISGHVYRRSTLFFDGFTLCEILREKLSKPIKDEEESEDGDGEPTGDIEVVDLSMAVLCLEDYDKCRTYKDFLNIYSTRDLAMSILSLPRKIILMDMYDDNGVGYPGITAVMEYLKTRKVTVNGWPVLIKDRGYGAEEIFDIIHPDEIYLPNKQIIFLEHNWTDQLDDADIDAATYAYIKYPDVYGTRDVIESEFLIDGIEYIKRCLDLRK